MGEILPGICYYTGMYINILMFKNKFSKLMLITNCKFIHFNNGFN